jgi:hypothetical protein
MHLSRPADHGTITRYVADHLPGSVAEALALASELTAAGSSSDEPSSADPSSADPTPAPVPGTGRTADLWRALAVLAAHDVALARAVEPHLDAVAILTQAADAARTADAGLGRGTRGEATGVVLPPRASSAGFTWGVFAAEAPPGAAPRLEARPASPATASGDEEARLDSPTTAREASAQDPAAAWLLSGEKPWCSLAGELDGALVTAWVGDERRLFAVDLRQPGVEVVEGAWHARGMAEIPSGPVRFDEVEAFPVGAPGWYLRRAGFDWGGIGVASCWYGGAVGVARALHAAAVQRDPDPWLLRALGVVDERLGDARRALAEAAELVDSGAASGAEGRLLAKRVRGTVAHAAEGVLAAVAHALGPAPLASDAAHAKRVADLELYLRQHHAEKDDASLGGAVRDRALAAGASAPGGSASATATTGVDPW